MHVTVASNDPDEVHRFAEPAFSAFYAAAVLLLDATCSVVIEAAFHADLECADRMDAHEFPWGTYIIELTGIPTLDVDTARGYEPQLDVVTNFVRTSA